MGDRVLDNLDRRILHLLQLDARGMTDTDIASDTGVSSTTIHNRIEALEDLGVIRGYHPEIDYESAGYPLSVLFIGSVPMSDRSAVAERALEIDGVVNVRELMSGEGNLHVMAVAGSTDETERITEELDTLGLRINSSEIVSTERFQPWDHFHLSNDADDEDEGS
ncbi:Lrp/AsnC family transcriptional regulator [Haloarchaeobius baliensis]|uniref:Lrp/AsnC family transcriptional regulator n=1 Tax=Haloarchaeobius baliensis TaxID=1670458 RepID=UPI003F8819F0